MPRKLFLNIDADEPTARTGIVPSYKNKLRLIRAAFIYGYGTVPGGKGQALRALGAPQGLDRMA